MTNTIYENMRKLALTKVKGNTMRPAKHVAQDFANRVHAGRWTDTEIHDLELLIYQARKDAARNALQAAVNGLETALVDFEP